MTSTPEGDPSAQLTLSFTPPDSRDFEHFVPGNNAGVVMAVQAAARRPSAIWPLIWGPADCGKTHLLMAATAFSVDQDRRAIYLDAGELLPHGPQALEAVQGAEFVSLDGIDRLFGQAAWEEALFHAFNRLRRAGAGLLMSAATAPASFQIGLGDLRSRLNWGTTHAMFPLDEAGKREAMVLRADLHGVTVGDEVLDYLLGRSRRGVGDLVRRIDGLAQLSFAEKRPITIPLVRRLLQSQDKGSET